MSAANRRRGNQFERDLAAWLRDRLGCDVRTGRDARGGAQTPGDLQWQDDDGRWWPGVKGITVEAKDCAGLAVPTWLDQARQAAALDRNDWWCVVHKTRRAPVGQARVFVPRGMTHDFLQYGEPSDTYSLADHTWMTLDAFCEVWW